MKTNVNMLKKMGNFEIPQRTKDGYFNANYLLKQWNKENSKREIKRFLDSPKTKEFAEILSHDAEMRNADNQPFIIKKGRNTKNGKTPDEVWMHPYLFIDFAMWINPKFKLDVIRFVYDQLIEFRHNAGDYYKGLTSAVQIFNKVNYSQLAKGLNYIIFGKHETGLRQIATQKQLQELTELQKQLAFAIDMGYIKSFDELLNEMRRIWNMKNLRFNS